MIYYVLNEFIFFNLVFFIKLLLIDDITVKIIIFSCHFIL